MGHEQLLKQMIVVAALATLLHSSIDQPASDGKVVGSSRQPPQPPLFNAYFSTCIAALY